MKNLLTKKQINNYQQNGVIPIYGLFKPWIKDIANGIKKILTHQEYILVKIQSLMKKVASSKIIATGIE